MVMGFSMALSHTLVLLLLGALLFMFSSQVAENVSSLVLIGSPLLVIGIGIYMLYRIYGKEKHVGCSCKHHKQEDHHNSNQVINTRTAAFVGFTGGLLPCPSAIAVFSLSGTHGDPQSAFYLMLLYICGFITIMALLIFVASFIKNRLVAGYFTEKKNLLIQKISAVAILLTGVIYLAHNIVDHM